jgi:GNAT superfamily N-acetyltransferase
MSEHSNAPPFVFRLADIKDVPLVLAMRERAAWAAMPTKIRRRMAAIYERELNRRFYCVLGVCDGLAVSAAFMSIVSDPDVPGEGYGIVFNLYTEPDFRGNGLASTCLGTIVVVGKALGLSHLEAEVGAMSRNIFRAQGFEMRTRQPHGQNAYQYCYK